MTLLPHPPFKKRRKFRDMDGREVKAGDVVGFSYGIPPVRVRAPVIERDGRLIALTEGHNPSECPVSQLKKYIGDFWIVGEAS